MPDRNEGRHPLDAAWLHRPAVGRNRLVGDAEVMAAAHDITETGAKEMMKAAFGGHHEPLITVETFNKVQARRNGVAMAPLRRNAGDDFALRGMALCADCGVPLRSSWGKGRDKSYAYYLCQTKTCESYGKSIPATSLRMTSVL
ncbi:zinc ribbon domain-containing protein [Rhizobium leguminosarum]|uniref:zinc ribbon domain-containing protein n=1 Tax=Rhizobium leguminosarum TaxID=384 RepID=UPI001C95B0AA|nr:zinc ribbon domain-containing protein [Rhizobium leguminosarum]MBY5361933.1 hypothetical protein [Rhizobium leguminosarum]MBY5664963.1 hypothetical protein [Rhizobium leguminosarum]MBY5677553.1 hypothetical protein [Rhizobium leguminosarum]